jgi:hypothetical protein
MEFSALETKADKRLTSTTLRVNQHFYKTLLGRQEAVARPRPTPVQAASRP